MAANPRRVPLPGDTIWELQAKWLNCIKIGIMADANDPRPADTENKLLQKILNRINEQNLGTGPQTPWIQGDDDAAIYRKILTKLGGS